MPYIKTEDRARARIIPKTAGELNYAISCLVGEYVLREGLNYQHINDCVGAMEGAKAEFQRRVVAPYEDLKIKENGDVYPITLLSVKDPSSP